MKNFIKKINIIIFVFIFIIISLSNSKEAFFYNWSNLLDFPSENSPFNMNHFNEDIDSNDFIFIKDGKFYNKKGTIRFFGTNLTFDSAFPEHEEAEKLALQIARSGMNIVRLHHLDNRDIWGQNKDFSSFDPVQMEKLDYLIYQLKKNGIYINLNLHVSWIYPSTKNYDYTKLIKDNYVFKYGKGIDNYMPELIEMQKKYASDILNHKNPYTSFKYKEDPVIAMVEINNENSFYRNILVKNGFDYLEEPYKVILDKGFQAYLKNKYQSINKIKEAWSIPKNSNIKSIEGISPYNISNNWKIQIKDQKKGVISLNNNHIKIKLNNFENNGYFQFFKHGLSLQKNKTYTITFEVKAKPDAHFNLSVMEAVSPWSNAGLSKKILITKNGFQKEIISFIANKDFEKTGRINFSSFQESNIFEFKNINLYEVKLLVDPLEKIKSIDDLKIPQVSSYFNYPENYQKDLITYFYLLEKKYWETMINHLKNTIGLKVPVTGTQIEYTYLDFADLFDYIDIHSYWQHPSFPLGGYNRKEYYVKNLSVISSDICNFSEVILHRIKGKPYTISEYNHPFPNEYMAETTTFLAVISKLQDYDGIFYFNLLNNKDNFNKGTLFSMFNNFLKKSMLPIASNIYRNESIRAFSHSTELPVNINDSFKLAMGMNLFTNPYCHFFYNKSEYDNYLYSNKAKIYIYFKQGKNIDYYEILKNMDNKKDERFVWYREKTDYKKSYFLFNDDYAKVFFGWQQKNHQYNFNNITLKNVYSSNDFFIFTLFNKNGKIGEKGTYLLTLNNKNRYTNMEYLDYDTNRSIDLKDDNYGKKIYAKSKADINLEQLESLSGELTILFNSSKIDNIDIYTLNELGDLDKQINYTLKKNELNIKFKAEYSSIIYVIQVK